MHACMHTYIHTYIHTHRQTSKQANKQTCKHANILRDTCRYFVEASGHFFGTVDYSPVLQLENRQCEATIWVSDSFALCKVLSPFAMLLTCVVHLCVCVMLLTRV